MLAAASEGTEPLRVRLLGSPHVSYGARTVRFAAARTLPLFAYLLLHRERATERGALAFTFWPDCSESESRANLRRHLHRLASALPDVAGLAWFQATTKTVQWNRLAPLDFDVETLEAAAAGIRDLADAADLYAGDLYADLDDEWILRYRERARTMYLDVLARLIARHRGELRLHEAIELAQRTLHVDPFREDGVRMLMTLRYESGDRSGALAEFAHFRKRLHAELGAMPMNETQALHDAIRRHVVLEPRSGSSDITPVAHALHFAGRDDDMERLRAAWAHAARGTGNVAFVSGDAGVGKSRLVTEFAHLAEREGGRILAGATSRPEVMPFESIVDALQRAVTEIDRLPLGASLMSALATALPELRIARPDLAEPAPLARDRERARFFEAIARAFALLAQSRPTILILEDVHDARQGTLDLVGAVVRTCATAPLLVIVTYRDGESGPELRDLIRSIDARRALRLALAPLTREAAASILAQTYSEATLPVSDAAHIATICEGNPLFLTELAREYRSRTAQSALTSGARAHTSLHATILTRLERLSEGGRTIAEIAAIAGSPFSVDVVHFVSRWPLADVLSAIDELLDRWIVRETANGSSGDYEFSHDVLRETIFATCSPEKMPLRHRRTARALQEHDGARSRKRITSIASHFEAGGQFAEAAAAYREAAASALDRFAWSEAIVLADRGFAIGLDPRVRFALLATAESAATRLADHTIRQRHLDDMAQIAEACDDDALRADLLARQTDLAMQLGDRPREIAAIDALDAVVARSSDERLVRTALRARARRAIHDDAPTRAIALLLEIDRLGNLRRTVAERVADLSDLAHAQAKTFAFDEARATATRAQTLARSEGGIADRLAALRARAKVADDCNDYASLAAIGPELLESCRLVGDVEGETNAYQLVARTTAFSFDIAATREHLAAGIAIAERIGKIRNVAALSTNLGVVENHVGRFAEARIAYDHAERLWASCDSTSGRALCHLNLAYLAYCTNEPMRALEAIERGFAFATEVGDTLLVTVATAHRGTILRELGDFDRAYALLSQALASFETIAIGDERCEALLELLPLYIVRGESARAIAAANELVAVIDDASVAIAFPVYALLRASDAHAFAGDDRHASILRGRARTLLAERLARIPDAATRIAYAAVRFHAGARAPSEA